MSIFSKIAAAEHTFAAWAEKELQKLIGEAPTVIDIADTTLAYAGPLLQTVVTATAGQAAGAEVAAVVKEALIDLTVVRGVIVDAGPVPSASSMLASIQANLSGLLMSSHITDPASVTILTKVLKEIAALSAAFPVAETAAA